MTREEAIKVLSSYDVNGVWADVDGKPYNAEEQAEAFDMAIEALKDQDRPIICESEGRQAKLVTKGEYMVFKEIKRMSHVDPEETADRGFTELIDTITENTMVSVIVIPHETKDISTNTSTNTSTKSTNISTEPTTEAPRSIEPTITVDLESGVVPRSAIEKRPHDVTKRYEK